MTKIEVTTDQMAVALAAAVDIDRELDEDYVGLWVLPRCIRLDWPHPNDRLVRSISTSILLALTSRDVVLGDLDGDTGEFLPWSVADPVETAMAMWVRLGRDPRLGEIAWLSREVRALDQ
jgi:hypothetical protein